VKSDDIRGRDKTYERIVKGQSLVKPGIPESFRVLVKELQGLGLDVEVQYDDGTVGAMVLEDEDDERAMRRYSATAGSSFFEETEEHKDRASFASEAGEGLDSEELLEDADMFAIPDLFLEKGALSEGMSLVEEEELGEEELEKEEGTDVWPEEK
jgi:DNA-directed RNA polymerase subunit beta